MAVGAIGVVEVLVAGDAVLESTAPEDDDDDDDDDVCDTKGRIPTRHASTNIFPLDMPIYTPPRASMAFRVGPSWAADTIAGVCGSTKHVRSAFAATYSSLVQEDISLCASISSMAPSAID